MNFLLHCWFGREDEGLVAGGFLGDFVKGPIPDSCPDKLRVGIQLHRYIDRESNQLLEMRDTYFRFGKNLRRPASILLDIVADHIFAKYWHEYTDLNLKQFTQHCYQAIGQFERPPSAERIYEHMCRTDLFASYADVNVIFPICDRILKRLHFAQHSDELETILVSEHNEFKQDFDVYFPLLQRKVSEWLQTHRN